MKYNTGWPTICTCIW